VIHERGFDDTFYYFGNERQIRDWPIVGEFLFIQSGFLKQLWDNGFLERVMKLAGSERKVDNIGDCGNKYTAPLGHILASSAGCGLLLKMSHVPWSDCPVGACVYMCVGHTAVPCKTDE